MLTVLIYGICATLSAGGMLLAFRAARRRRYAAALRTAGIALLPIGLAMTGLVRFVINMTINPIAWVGFATIGLATLLYMASRLAEGKGAPAAPASGTAGDGGGAPAEAPPALPAGGRGGPPAKKGDDGGGEDFSDIEAILKRHGI